MIEDLKVKEYIKEFTNLQDAVSYRRKVNGELNTINTEKVVGTYDCYFVEKETKYIVKLKK